MYREYDMAVFQNLSVFKLEDSNGKIKEVPRIFSTPERAYARLHKVMTVPGREKENRTQDNITLPMVSVTRLGDGELDWGRYRMAPSRRLKYTDGMGRVFNSPASTPYNLMYQIDIWAKKSRHINAMLESYMAQFNGDIMVLRVQISEPGSENREKLKKVPTGPCEVYLTDISDNSDVEPGEDQERLLRKTFTIEVKAWLHKQASSVATVRNILISFEDESGVVQELEYDESLLGE